VTNFSATNDSIKKNLMRSGGALLMRFFLYFSIISNTNMQAVHTSKVNVTHNILLWSSKVSKKKYGVLLKEYSTECKTTGYPIAAAGNQYSGFGFLEISKDPLCGVKDEGIKSLNTTFHENKKSFRCLFANTFNLAFQHI
jgi:hypothetical protein